MPKTIELPVKLKFETIAGKDFIEVKSAAKLAGVHPVVLEMGQLLMKAVDGKAATFFLGTPEMVKKGEEIEQMIVKGLKKVARAFGNNLTVKSYRSGEYLYFWYGQGWSKKAKA